MAGYLYGPVHGFMIWNGFLAVIPAVLAVGLFRADARRGAGWWLGFVIWVLFLPNAPYLLTDVVHMVGDLRSAHSDVHAYLVMALYGAFFAFGLAAYAFSLQRFRRYLHRTIDSRLVAPTILVLHALCVFAMYLGRVVRLNSSDALLAPGRVASAVLRVPRPMTLAVMAVMFVVVGAGTFMTVAIGDKLAVQARRRHVI